MNGLPEPKKAAIEAIDSYVQRSLAEKETPGLALAITNRETLLYEGYYGYADLKLRTPVGDYSMQALRAALAGVELPPDPEPREAFKTEKAADYARSYAALAGDRLRFRAEGDRLVLVTPSGQGVKLEARGEDAFYTPHPDYDRYGFRFARNDSGEVVEVFHGSRWYVGQGYDGPTTFDMPAEWRAFVGRYRSYSPWYPYFEVLARKGRLMAFTPQEDDVPSSEQVLTETASGLFRVGPDPSPEVIHFGDVVAGRAL